MIKKSKREIPDLEERIRQLEIKYVTKYSHEQIQAIDYGLSINAPVELYADPKYNAEQMCELFEATSNGLDPTPMKNPEFNAKQMHEIYLGLKNGVDVNIYAQPNKTHRMMGWIRLALQKNIDVNAYPEFSQNGTAAQRKYLQLNNQLIQPHGNKKGFIKVKRIRIEEYYMEVKTEAKTDITDGIQRLNEERIETIPILKEKLIVRGIFPVEGNLLKPTGKVETYLNLSPIKENTK